MRVQEFTTADGQKLIGKRAYLAHRKEQRQGAGDGGTFGGAFDGGDHGNDRTAWRSRAGQPGIAGHDSLAQQGDFDGCDHSGGHALQTDTPQAAMPDSRRNKAPAKRKGTPQTAPAKQRANAKRGSTSWDPHSRVSFDI